MESKHEELESLLFDWEAGTLDESGLQRVRQILRADPDAREQFLQMQTLSAALRLEVDAGLGSGLAQTEGTAVATDREIVESSANRRLPESVSDNDSAADRSNLPRKESTRRVSRAYLWFAAAAALLVCILAGRLAYVEFDRQSREVARIDPPSPRRISDEATSSGIALVTRLVDVVWEEGQTPLEVGDALEPGPFAMKAGFAQVEFFCGATVIVEGPAELDLQSTMLARVHRGRLRAQVPPAARGFSIDVADMKVVDLGTEFGLSVSPAGTDLQVFDGEVELHRPAAENRLLKAGQALVRDASGSYEEAKVTPQQFTDIATLESRERLQQAERFKRWKEWSGELRNDQRLIAYYAFDQQGGWQRRLRSNIQSPVGEVDGHDGDDNAALGSELDGAIVGARQVAGRWDQKKALEFKQPGDRVRVQIPGEFGSLTFACWVKIDSLDRWYNSLFLTDGYNQGEPHWQILDTGQIYFSVRPAKQAESGPRDHKVLSPSFWEPSMSGKWLHLATTYDIDTGLAIHYLNGEVLHSEKIPDERLAKTTRIGAASIGNWSAPTMPNAEFAIRNLNGRIDEFAIFSAALSSADIMEMYENGKP